MNQFSTTIETPKSKNSKKPWWVKIAKVYACLLILAVFFASFYEEVQAYLNKMKLLSLDKYLLSIVIIVLILSTLIPAILTALKQDLPSNEEVEAFRWLRDNSPKNSGVIALLEEGNLITYYSQRKNIIDDQFMRVKDVDKRFADLNSLYNTKFQTHALSLLDEYKYSYLVLTPKAKQKYDLVNFDYLSPECFERVYKNETRIYKAVCSLEAVKS